MSAPPIASANATRTAPRLATVALATIVAMVAAIAILALAAWHPWSTSEPARVQSHYGAGYPQHGGLAGPSRISVYDQYPGYWRAYLPEGNGPSGTSVYDQYPGYWRAYLPEGVGPSRVSPFEHPGYGPGYPLHGGLAGPSQVGDGD